MTGDSRLAASSCLTSLEEGVFGFQILKLGYYLESVRALVMPTPREERCRQREQQVSRRGATGVKRVFWGGWVIIPVLPSIYSFVR